MIRLWSVLSDKVLAKDSLKYANSLRLEFLNLIQLRQKFLWFSSVRTELHLAAVLRWTLPRLRSTPQNAFPQKD